MRFVILCF